MQRPTDYGTIKRHLWPLPLEVIMGIGLITAFFTYHKGVSALHITAPLFALLISFAPLLFERITRIRLPALLQFLFVVFIISSLFIGTYLGLYGIWTFWDKVIHFGSGVLVAIYSLVLLAVLAKRYKFSMPTWLQATLVIAIGGSTALLWEIAEFISDTYFGTHAQITNADTMTDMINGLAGATLVIALVAWQHRAGGQTFLDPLTKKTTQLNRRKLPSLF